MSTIVDTLVLCAYDIMTSTSILPDSNGFLALSLFRAGGAESAPPSTFLYLAQKPLYLINRRLSTFPIYLLGLRICKKNRFRYGVCAHRGHD